jgi:hypothetical protein
VTLRPQARSQTKPDVVAPRAPRANSRPLEQAGLLEPAVVVLSRPRAARPRDPFQVAHLDFIRRPQLNAAVCGDYLEAADGPEAFEPHHPPRLPDLDFTDGTQARPVGVHFAVTPEPGQPDPAGRADQLQALKPGVPTTGGHAGGRTASLVRLLGRRPEVVVLRQSVPPLVEDAIVSGDVAVAARPQERNQVDAAHHRVVLARPVAHHRLHLLRVGLVQGRVVYDKDALAQADLAFGFTPQRRGVRLQTTRQAGERIMGRRLPLVALDFRRFGRAHGARRGNHEVDVVIVRTFRRIHALFLLHFLQLRNF